MEEAGNVRQVDVCVGTSAFPFSRGRSQDFVTLAIHKDLGLGSARSQSRPPSGAANKIRKPVHREALTHNAAP